MSDSLQIGDILQTLRTVGKTFWIVESLGKSKARATLRKLEWCDMDKPGCMMKTDNKIIKKVYSNGIWLDRTTHLEKANQQITIVERES